MEESKKAIVKLQKLLDKAIRFISFRPRSEKEIKDYLYKKNPKNSQLCGVVLIELKSLGLVGDKEFVSWWLEQRASFRPRGERLLVLELLQKGIDKELIDEMVKGNIDELPLARKALKKKSKSLQDLSPLKERKKMNDFLLRRGFSYEVIKRVLDETLKKQ